MDEIESLEDLTPAIESIEESISIICEDMQRAIDESNHTGAVLSDLQAVLEERLSAVESKLNQLLDRSNNNG